MNGVKRADRTALQCMSTGPEQTRTTGLQLKSAPARLVLAGVCLFLLLCVGCSPPLNGVETEVMPTGTKIAALREHPSLALPAMDLAAAPNTETATFALG